MKKIQWFLFEHTITFNLNWFEYLILANIFKKEKYQIKPNKIRGYTAHTVIMDEIK